MEAELPYGKSNPSSGFAKGVDTSEDAVRAQDADGRTKTQQFKALALLSDRGRRGATWQEVAAHYGWGHGPTSRTLSVLHKTDRIARLSEKRGRSKVYVLPEHVDNRETEKQGRNRKSVTPGKIQNIIQDWGIYCPDELAQELYEELT